MTVLKYTAVLIILCFLDLHATANDEEKRILLNDPSLLNQRLTHVESQLQQQQTLVQQQQASLLKQEALIQQQQTLLQQQQTKISTLENQQQSVSSLGLGAVFTRWGKKTCPNNTETVYSGYAEGGYYNNKGASSDYICLPNNPKAGPSAGTSAVGYLYGVEFETNFWKSGAQNEDPACCVCRSSHQMSALMIPGRDQCYTGWTMQFQGHLASSHYYHPSGKNYVCVDKDPDYITGGGKGTDGALFYPVITQCGALPCPPYTDGKTVFCVICTK